MKDAIVRALEMPAAEQGRRMRALRKRVRDHDVEDWSQDFLEALSVFHEKASSAAAAAEVTAATTAPLPSSSPSTRRMRMTGSQLDPIRIDEGMDAG